jgi:hypothetical protein
VRGKKDRQGTVRGKKDSVFEEEERAREEGDCIQYIFLYKGASCPT